MTALQALRSCLRGAQNVKLSTGLVVLFTVAVLLPWIVFGWLNTGDRDDQIAKVERHLTALAAAYGEHAATLERLGVSVPTGEVVSLSQLSSTASRGAKEMAAFRQALTVPGVRFTMHRIKKSEAAASPRIYRTADIAVDVPQAEDGIGVTASINENAALAGWTHQTFIAVASLLLRSLFIIGIAIFFVRQLRWREKLQAELAVAIEAAQSASRAKSDFLANTSHELRTPLNAIIGFSEVIKLGLFGPVSLRYREYAADIFNSGTHLLKLINELLDLSKLEAGRFTLYEEDVDLAVIVHESVRLVEAQAKKLNIEISETLPGDLPLIRADDRRMRQILINLLSNAVKFTPDDGRVNVSAALSKQGLTLDISDSGIGMAPEQISKALEPFGQIDSKISRKYEGSGLGLPLTKQLVELHGGTLTIASQANIGTTVSVFLPIERIVVKPDLRLIGLGG